MKTIILILALTLVSFQVFAKPMSIDKTKNEAIDCLAKSPLDNSDYQIINIGGEIREIQGGNAHDTFVVIEFNTSTCLTGRELRYGYVCPKTLPFCFKAVPVLTNCNGDEERLDFSCNEFE